MNPVTPPVKSVFVNLNCDIRVAAPPSDSRALACHAGGFGDGARYCHAGGFGGWTLNHGGRRTLSSGYVSKSTTVNLDRYRGRRFRGVLGDELSGPAGMNPVTPPARLVFINLNCDLRVAAPSTDWQALGYHAGGFGGGARYQGGRRTLSSGYVSKSTTVNLDT